MKGWNDPPDLYSMQCTNSHSSDNPFRRKAASKTTTNSRSNNSSQATSNPMSSSSVLPFLDPTKVQTSPQTSHMSSASNYYSNNLSMGLDNQTNQDHRVTHQQPVHIPPPTEIPPPSLSSLLHPGTLQQQNGYHTMSATQNGHLYPPFGTVQPAEEFKGTTNGSMGHPHINNIAPSSLNGGNTSYNGASWTENGYGSNAPPLYNNFSYNSNHTQSNLPYSN